MDAEDLKNIAHEINTQDNRITADPLFCVFEKERIYGMDREWADTCEIDDNGNKVYFVERDKFVNAHFTESAAKEHIRINGHNLKRPFIYVTSLWRCEEMIQIRNMLANPASSGDGINNCGCSETAAIIKNGICQNCGRVRA